MAKAKKEKVEFAGNSAKNSVPEELKPFVFKPGQSGNPSGRPKKKPLTDAYAEILNNPEKARQLAAAMFAQGLLGNTKALVEMADRVEGKVLQGIRMEGELGITGESERKSKVLDILREGAQRIEKIN